MEADKIIQQKEWSQLSNAEKIFLSPLASSETEFNLLKKMMQVATEEKLDVPMLPARLWPNIQQQMGRQRKSRFPIWLAAAAALLVIVLAIFFVLRQPTGKEIVKTGKPALPPTSKPGLIAPGTDSSYSPVDPSITINLPATKKLATTPVIKRPVQHINADTTTVSKPTFYSGADIAVSGDPSLLSLVTEVY